MLHLKPCPIHHETGPPPGGDVLRIQSNDMVLATAQPEVASLPAGVAEGATVIIMGSGQLNNQWPTGIAGPGTWSEVVRYYDGPDLNRPVYIWKGLNVPAGSSSWNVTYGNANHDNKQYSVIELTPGADVFAIGAQNFNPNGLTHSLAPLGINHPAGSCGVGTKRHNGNVTTHTPQAIAGATRYDVQNTGGNNQHDHSVIEFSLAATGETADTVVNLNRITNVCYAVLTLGGT